MENSNLVEKHRQEIESILKQIIIKIGRIQIGKIEQFPFGWRQSAKGRTVWRILEEAINQNLEKYSEEFDSYTFTPPHSEVGVYDFSLQLRCCSRNLYVNIKSASIGGKTNKDDMSKANKLVDFFEEDKKQELYIASFEIMFNDDMSIEISNCFVMPIMWLPDIYINPSNNNLQSSKYKNVDLATKRTSLEFLKALKFELEVAKEKKRQKQSL